MCGIAGIVFVDRNRPPDIELITRMMERLQHRGPDGEGIWQGPGAALGFRRLAIIDLETGDQPILNEDRSLAMVFNGEIYNYRELRAILESHGHRFITNTDSETILHGYEQWGSDVVNHLRGMFAFAIIDMRSNDLFLARDRFGKKPLYYSIINKGTADEALIFSSEMRALLSEPAVSREISHTALLEFLVYQFIEDPRTILSNVHKLESAHFLRYSAGKVETHLYWTLHYEPKVQITESDAIDGLRHHLSEAVRLRLRSDVPLGIYLSAGVDSSAVAAFARQFIQGELITVSARAPFDVQKNELSVARRTAESLGTRHYEIEIEAELHRSLTDIVWNVGEPNSKFTAISFLYLHRFARQFATVMLSGDGGDELFVGYDRYIYFEKYNSARSIPVPVRKLLLKLLPNSFFSGRTTRRYKLSRHLAGSLLSTGEIFTASRSVFKMHELNLLATGDLKSALRQSSPMEVMCSYVDVERKEHPIDQMMWGDLMMHMRSQTLPILDRLSMSVGLEVRSPFLDQELAQFTAQLPMELKFKDAKLKYLLRKALSDILPAEVIAGPKIGFGNPNRNWFGSEISNLARELLLDSTAKRRNLFNSSYIEELLKRYKSDKSYRFQIWGLLVFETWCRTFLDTSEPPAQPLSLDCIAGKPVNKAA